MCCWFVGLVVGALLGGRVGQVGPACSYWIRGTLLLKRIFLHSGEGGREAPISCLMINEEMSL